MIQKTLKYILKNPKTQCLMNFKHPYLHKKLVEKFATKIRGAETFIIYDSNLFATTSADAKKAQIFKI